MLAKGVGATHLGAGHDRRPRLRARPRRARPARRSARFARRTPTIPTRASAPPRVAPALDWFAERVARRPAAGLSLPRRPRAQPPAADGRRRAAARRRSCPRRWPRATCARAARCASSGSRALRDFHAALLRRQPRRAAGHRGAGDRASTSTRRPRRRQRARPRAARSTTPTSARAFAGAARAAAARRRARRAARPCSACATRTARGPTCSGAWAAASSRSRRCRRRCRACASSRPCARRCARAGGRLVLGTEVVGAEREGGRVTAVRAPRRGPRRALPRALVRARHRRLRVGRHRARLGLGHARDGARAAAARRAGARRAALRGRLLRRAADGAGRGGGRRRRCAPRAPRTCSWPAPRCPAPCPWQENSGEGIALASGHRAAEVVLAEGADVRGGGMSEGVLEELLRGSLDHCVKCTICETACPVSNVTPLFPGPKYAGPQAERYRVADEPSVETSVDYCSGCGICTQVCPQGVKIAEINAQARNKLKRQKGVPLRDRIIARPTWLGRAGTPAAPIANWTIDAQAAADPRREAAEGPPRRAGARVRRAALLALGAQAREPAHRAQGRLLPRLRHRVLRARGGREGRRHPRAQRLRGRGPQAGLLRAAAAVQRPLRRRAQGRAAPGAQPRQARARRGHDHRRQRHELHADAQARGARDPRASRTTPTSSWSASAPTTSASCCSSCTTAAS